MSAVVKRGDTLPALTLTVTDDGTPVDLTEATGIRLLVRASADRGSGDPYLEATLADRPANGVLTYAWQAGDTATAGTYRVEVEVTWPDGAVQTFPGAGYGDLRIVPDLG